VSGGPVVPRAQLTAAMTCQEAIEKLVEYLDGELTPEGLGRLEAHLEACAPCRAYFATYRRTKELAAKASRVEMPEDLKRRLRALLGDQIRGPS
jgi:mycothiol system anti-sigma-R factor